MTDPSWIVQKAYQFNECSNRHGAIPCKTLVVFFTRIAKQPVLVYIYPCYSLIQKEEKHDCLHAIWAH